MVTGMVRLFFEPCCYFCVLVIKYRRSQNATVSQLEAKIVLFKYVTQLGILIKYKGRRQLDVGRVRGLARVVYIHWN